MHSTLDHIALLTESIEQTCQKLSLDPAGIEEFPEEGTRELYLGPATQPRLLLMQPIAAGPYQRALSKRGPGLHHVALCVPDPRHFALQAGWLLHPYSLEVIPQQLWLAHPAVPSLIEVITIDPLDQGGLSLTLPGRRDLVSNLSCAAVRPGTSLQLMFQGSTWPIAALV